MTREERDLGRIFNEVPERYDRVRPGSPTGLFRSTSIYRKLERDVREALLDAIAHRIRTQTGDRVPRAI